MKEMYRRKVYKAPTFFRKVYLDLDAEWMESHVRALNSIDPSIVADCGTVDDDVFIDYNIVPGITIAEYNDTHDAPFSVDRIREFCYDSLIRTLPYGHLDWNFNNIMYDSDTDQLGLVDWDDMTICSVPHMKGKIELDIRISTRTVTEEDKPLLDVWGISWNDEFRANEARG